MDVAQFDDDGNAIGKHAGAARQGGRLGKATWLIGSARHNDHASRVIATQHVANWLIGAMLTTLRV